MLKDAQEEIDCLWKEVGLQEEAIAAHKNFLVKRTLEHP